MMMTMMRVVIIPGLYQDYARIMPGLYQDYTRSIALRAAAKVEALAGRPPHVIVSLLHRSFLLFVVARVFVVVVGAFCR